MVMLWWQSRHDTSSSPGSTIRSNRVGEPVMVQVPYSLRHRVVRRTSYMESALPGDAAVPDAQLGWWLRRFTRLVLRRQASCVLISLGEEQKRVSDIQKLVQQVHALLR